MQRFFWRVLFVLLLAGGAWLLVGQPGPGVREHPKEVERATGAHETARPERLPLWSQTATLTARENAEAHWEKHQREFPEYRSAQEYIEAAHRFLRGPPEGTLRKTRSNGDRLFYHPETNTFAVQARNGAPRTMFRPSSGLRYWNRQ